MQDHPYWGDRDFAFIAERLKEIQSRHEAASPKARPELPGPGGNGHERYFEWWRHQFFSDEGGGP